MDIFDIIILSVIEGITEFLPISSTGHLILTSDLLQIPKSDFLNTFMISIQSGAVLAVVNLYWRKFRDDPSLILKAVVGLIPTSIIGVLLYSTIKDYLLDNVFIVAISLILGGIAIILIEKYLFKDQYAKDGLSKISYRQAFLTGLTQSLAIIPGVSRAASSIFGGMFVGLNRKTATEFSFILALPTIIAATALDLSVEGPGFTNMEIVYLFIGIILSFFVALFAIKWLVKYVSNHTFTNFGWYRIVLGLIFLLLFLNK